MISHQEKHDFIQGLIWSKHEWLKSHGGAKSRWPEHEIQRKQGELKAYIDGIADAMGCDDRCFKVDYPCVFAGTKKGGEVVFRVSPT